MNITLSFYLDKDTAGLVDLVYHDNDPHTGIGLEQFKAVQELTFSTAGSYVEELLKLLMKPNDIQPIVTPPVEVRSTTAPDPEPAEEAKPLTMEDVRKVLIEVKKTKGVEGLKRCFSVVGADKLPNVDPSEYGALYSAAKGELDA